jgi:hypothetical protein
MSVEQNVYVYMMNNYAYHVDPSCNVLNLTHLAEDAAEEFNLYEDEIDFVIPEWVFDLAYDIDKVLIQRGICQQ